MRNLDFILEMTVQERTLEAEQALRCLLNPWECWNALGLSPAWDLPEKHLKPGNSLIRPRIWPGKQNGIMQPPPIT